MCTLFSLAVSLYFKHRNAWTPNLHHSKPLFHIESSNKHYVIHAVWQSFKVVDLGLYILGEKDHHKMWALLHYQGTVPSFITDSVNSFVICLASWAVLWWPKSSRFNHELSPVWHPLSSVRSCRCWIWPASVSECNQLWSAISARVMEVACWGCRRRGFLNAFHLLEMIPNAFSEIENMLLFC